MEYYSQWNSLFYSWDNIHDITSIGILFIEGTGQSLVLQSRLARAWVYTTSTSWELGSQVYTSTSDHVTSYVTCNLLAWEMTESLNKTFNPYNQSILFNSVLEMLRQLSFFTGSRSWMVTRLVSFVNLTQMSHPERGSLNWENDSIRLSCRQVCGGILVPSPLKKFILCTYGCFSCTMYMPNLHKDQKRVLDFLESLWSYP